MMGSPNTMAPFENGRATRKWSQLRSNRWRAVKIVTGRIGAPERRAKVTTPPLRLRAGPRGPSGVKATACPSFSKATNLRIATAPPLSWSRSSRWVEPRTMTMPNRVMAWATSSPSPWRDTNTCNDFGPGQPTGVIIKLPCQVISINPVPWANKLSRKLPFVTCQIVVRSTSRTYWAAENPIRARPNGVPKNRFPRPPDVTPPIAPQLFCQCRVPPPGW